MSTTSSTEANTTITSTTSTTPTKVSPEQAVAFAALILADDNLAITSEKLQALLKAAGITEVEPIWTTLFSDALKGKEVNEILTTVAAAGPEAGGDTVEHLTGDHGHNKGETEPDGIDIDSGSDSDDIGCAFGIYD